jgi:hemolysin III
MTDGYGVVTRRRRQTLGEEIANAVSHGAGALLAVAAVPVLLVNALASGSPAVEVFAVAVFGASMAAMYLASTLYHALPARSAGLAAAKRVFRRLDHAAIYVLIAGTYTPFALGVFKESWGWSMFTLIWSLAVAGVLLKCFATRLYPGLSTVVYLGMGWLALAAFDPLLEELPRAGLAWLVAGGLAYTLGVVFYALDARVRYAHFTWHLFVLGGTACHFVAVLGYA